MELSPEEQKWWLALEQADYSWEGLGKKVGSTFQTTNGVRTVTLQEIYSNERERLIQAPNGKFYTEFHLPFCVLIDGKFVATEKMLWPDERWVEFNNALQNAKWKRQVRQGKSQLIYWNDDDEEIASDLPLRPYRLSVPVSTIGMSLRNLISNKGSDDLFRGNICGACFHNNVFCAENNFVVNYSNCLFIGSVYLDNMTQINFEDCIILESICANSNKDIKECRILGGSADNLSFVNSMCENLFVNSNIRRPAECEFHDSVFTFADFTGSGWALMAGFYRAAFTDLKLDSAVVGFSADKYFNEYVLKPILKKYPLSPFYKRWRLPVKEQHTQINAREAALHRLEGAVINLKKHYKDLWLEELSNRFYRFELRARENSPSAKGRMLSKWYRRLSDYGYDLWRPLVWIGALCFMLSLAYYGLYLAATGRALTLKFWAAFDPKFWDAISFSWGRIAPIIPWEGKDQTLAKDALPAVLHAGDLVGLTAHILAITQTFLSTGLIFLFGLAARRRFKIAD